MGGSRNFGKGGPVKGQIPEPSAEEMSENFARMPENFEKLDAISRNLAYFLGSEWPRISFRIGPLQNKKQ